MGYTGGGTPEPTYHHLGDHTETLQVDFDPQVLSYRDLLAIFWSSHDPGRRAWSVQYKAAVFVHEDEQEHQARETLEEVEAARRKPVRTEIQRAGPFYVAEDYHQKYYLRQDGVLMRDFRAIFGGDEAAFRESTAAARVNGYVAGEGTGMQLEEEIGLLGLSEAGRDRLAVRVRGGAGGSGCRIR